MGRIVKVDLKNRKLSDYPLLHFNEGTLQIIRYKKTDGVKNFTKLALIYQELINLNFSAVCLVLSACENHLPKKVGNIVERMPQVFPVSIS